jgi:HSP20 family molecular chaperone IbpA
VIVSRTAVPAIAFLEHEKGYVVTDMDKNDFEVTLSGGLLTIRGEKKESSDSFCLSEGTTDYSNGHSGSWRTLTMC